MPDVFPTPDETRRGLDLAMSTFPAGWERDSLARRAALAFAAERARLLAPDPVYTYRVTIERDEFTGWAGSLIPAKTITEEFDSMSEALDWTIDDGYGAETYTRKIVIEKVEVPQ